MAGGAGRARGSRRGNSTRCSKRLRLGGRRAWHGVVGADAAASPRGVGSECEGWRGARRHGPRRAALGRGRARARGAGGWGRHCGLRLAACAAPRWRRVCRRTRGAGLRMRHTMCERNAPCCAALPLGVCPAWQDFSHAHRVRLRCDVLRDPGASVASSTALKATLHPRTHPC